MRMLLSFAVLVLTASPAIADWTPQVFKSEFRMRGNLDGRGDTRESVSQARDAYDRAAGRPQRTGSERIAREINIPVPLKAEIALRAQNGDNRESSRPVSAATTRQQQSNQPATYAERERPPVPLKAEFVIKMQKGDNRDGNAKHSISMQPAGKNEANKGVFHRDPMSASAREALCRQTGVCLPGMQDKSDER